MTKSSRDSPCDICLYFANDKKVQGTHHVLSVSILQLGAEQREERTLGGWSLSHFMGGVSSSTSVDEQQV
jgi:hypothetical protein